MDDTGRPSGASTEWVRRDLLEAARRGDVVAAAHYALAYVAAYRRRALRNLLLRLFGHLRRRAGRPSRSAAARTAMHPADH